MCTQTYVVDTCRQCTGWQEGNKGANTPTLERHACLNSLAHCWPASFWLISSHKSHRFKLKPEDGWNSPTLFLFRHYFSCLSTCLRPFCERCLCWRWSYFLFENFHLLWTQFCQHVQEDALILYVLVYGFYDCCYILVLSAHAWTQFNGRLI